MKRSMRTAASIITCVLFLSIFVSSFNIKSTKGGSLSTDWWTSFHHDSAHSGYSTSTAPLTNQILWTYTTGDDVHSSPAVVDGVVYVTSWDGKVYALDSSNGSVVWSYTTGDSIFSSPAVADGIVYVGSGDNNVYALDANNGSLVWSYATGSIVFSSPAVAEGVVYVGTFAGKMYALDAANGSVVWSYTTGNHVESSPAVAEGVVYVGSYDNKVYAFNANNGSVVWSYTTGDSVFSSPAVVDGVVYVASCDSKVYALDAGNGSVVWSYTTEASVLSSPAVAYGVVYVGSGDKSVYALDAANGTVVWSYTTGNYIESSPSVADGVVFVGSSDDSVYALDAANGTVVWSYATGDFVLSVPAVVDGVVYVGSWDDKVYAFGTPTYDVTFTATGLASGTSWSVTFDGVNKSSTSDSISFTVPNGDYAYSVSVPSGYTSSSTLSGTLTVADANIIETIAFTQEEYVLTMIVIGEGTVSPGNGTYLSGANVSLEAAPSDGWNFNGWSGDATGTANTTIVMDGDKVVTATFTNDVIPELPSTILILILLTAISAIVMIFRSKWINVPAANLQKREKKII